MDRSAGVKTQISSAQKKHPRPTLKSYKTTKWKLETKKNHIFITARWKLTGFSYVFLYCLLCVLSPPVFSTHPHHPSPPPCPLPLVFCPRPHPNPPPSVTRTATQSVSPLLVLPRFQLLTPPTNHQTTIPSYHHTVTRASITYFCSLISSVHVRFIGSVRPFSSSVQFVRSVHVVSLSFHRQLDTREPIVATGFLFVLWKHDAARGALGAPLSVFATPLFLYLFVHCVLCPSLFVSLLPLVNTFSRAISSVRKSLNFSLICLPSFCLILSFSV